MKQTSHLQDAFSDCFAELRAARKVDPLLEETCLDFERLSADLELARNEPGRISAGLREDILTSIEGLKQEIFSRLSLPPESSM